MTTDHDPSSGYLPPHELRALIGSLQQDPHHSSTGPTPSPTPGLGLATAAASPTPLAPTLPSADDPGSLALAIARVAGEHLAGTSVVPLLHGPELPSPGISPQLIAQFPEPVSHHGDELRMPFLPAPTTSDVAAPPPHAGPQAFDPSPSPPAAWSSPPAAWSSPPAGLAATPPGLSSWSPPLAAFASTPPAGLAATAPVGLGATPPTGLAATPPTGLAATPPTGFASTPVGLGATPPAGLAATPPTGFASTPPAGLGATPPAGLAAARPAGLPATPPAGLDAPAGPTAPPLAPPPSPERSHTSYITHHTSDPWGGGSPEQLGRSHTSYITYDTGLPLDGADTRQRAAGHPGVSPPLTTSNAVAAPATTTSPHAASHDRGPAAESTPQRSDVAASSLALPSSAMLLDQQGAGGPALPWFPREPLVHGSAMPSGMPSGLPQVSTVPAVDALHMVGSELRMPFAMPVQGPWDEVASVPVQDHLTSGMPPMGGVGALQSPPGPPVLPVIDQPTDGVGLGGGSGREVFDPYRVRRDFPILEERVHGGKRLVWLDNAATTQKPRAVIDRLTYYYEHENSNVHRGAHALAARATDAFESARETTRKFLNAPSASEIVFVRGATEGINLIAKTFGDARVREGDEIVLTHLEHHANIVPWQQLAQRNGARLRVAPVDDRGDVIVEAYERLLGSRTKIVAFTQVSNALGTITPAREMIDIAHRYGATVVLDGAQAVSHMPVDVQALDCDFYVFSGHKVFAPTGIGAVFGKRQLLERMPPWQGGGNMIQDVTFERTVYQPPPWRFEAGTGNIADAAGMGAALDYVMRIGMPIIDAYEHGLLEYGTERLREVPGLRMIGTSRTKAGVLSFVLEGQRTEDVGAALDKHGIAVRSGHHCAQPIHRRFGIESTVRASLAFYNVREDIDALVEALFELQAQRVTIR